MQIREHAEVTPDKPAVIVHPSGTVVTFGEMEARANQLAHLFRRYGLREGDAVAILMENNAVYHTVMWGARRAGLYYVPINTHLTAAEVAYIIGNSAATAIVGSAALIAARMAPALLDYSVFCHCSAEASLLPCARSPNNRMACLLARSPLSLIIGAIVSAKHFSRISRAVL